MPVIRIARWNTSLVVAALLTMLGCADEGGPELVPVTGTVTLDGEPLEGALVRFQPVDTEAGSGSYGETDENGRYELQYTRDKRGAVIGQHTVTIAKLDENERNVLPEKVGGESTLEAEVKPGGGPIDFDLSTE